MSTLLERLYVHDMTPEGETLLEGDESLQRAMEILVDSPEAQKARVAGMRLLGTGKFSFVFAFRGELALKISNPCSGQESYKRKEALHPENLAEQFAVLSALRKHRGLGRNNIVVPEQFFVSYTPFRNFILAQEYMKGWQSLEDRTYAVYYDRLEDPESSEEVSQWTAAMRMRIQRCLEDFELAYKINDVGLEHAYGIHSGNVLVPEDADLNANTPLCIIDQPKEIFKK
jgi:hypothetical protein